MLSGGERRRLALAHVVASGANFLVLDEPTNHLDLESREALEAALEAFPGTVLLVSHDRALIDAVAERTLALEDRTIRSYDGGWAEYIRRREERAEPPRRAPSREPKKREAQAAAAAAAEAAAERARAAREPRSPQREEALAELERKLADDWANVETLQAHRRARDELQSLLGRWEELFERSQAQ